MKYRIKKVRVQDGFDTRTIYEVIELQTGKILAECDSRADARLEIQELDPLAFQKFKLRDNNVLAEREAHVLEQAEEQAKEEQQKQPLDIPVSEGTACEWDENQAQKANWKSVAFNDKSKRFSVEEQKNYLKRRKPVIWQDGSDRSERERYQSIPGSAPNDDPFEFYTSNPDLLENSKDQGGKPTKPQFLMAEAVKTLSPRQRKVWELCGREMRISFDDASRILRISKRSVQSHYARAIKNITKQLQGDTF